MSNGNGNGSHRVELKLPGGASVSASGTVVVLLVVIVAGFGVSLWYTEGLVREAREKQQTMINKLQDLSCIVALTPEEKLEARKAKDLAHWCAFVSSK